MMRVNEFFYGEEFPPESMVQTSAQQFIRDPKLFTVSSVVVVKPVVPTEDKNKPIVMRVSICCSECVTLIEYDLKKVTGVKKVECDTPGKKVTVTGTAPLADVLSAARKQFKDAKLWG